MTTPRWDNNAIMGPFGIRFNPHANIYREKGQNGNQRPFQRANHRYESFLFDPEISIKTKVFDDFTKKPTINKILNFKANTEKRVCYGQINDSVYSNDDMKRSFGFSV